MDHRVKPGGDAEKASLLTLQPEAHARRENAFLFVDTGPDPKRAMLSERQATTISMTANP